MQTSTLIVTLFLMSSAAYYFGKRRSLAMAGGRVRALHSLPGYYGLYTALWCLIPALLVLAIWLAFESTVITNSVVSRLPDGVLELPDKRLELVVNDIRNIVNRGSVESTKDPVIRQAASHYQSLMSVSKAAMAVVALALAMVGLGYARHRIQTTHRARNAVENILKILLIGCSSIAILTTLGIVLSVLFESLRFFQSVPPSDFLFGLKWSPQTAIRADQVGGSGAFGAIPLFTGTLLISFIAMSVAAPTGLMSAIYLSEYAEPRFRAIAKPLLEILAGIPTVVYGFFAALTVAPLIRETGAHLGLSVSSESALAAGLVMGIMIIPFVSSLSDDVINAVPQAMRDGALAMGATRSETVRQVIIPAALPGIVGGLLLAVSRAIGETMIVVMAAGLSANPLQAVTTVTVQIVTLLVGDQEFDSPKTLAAFALGLIFFLVTLVLCYELIMCPVM